LKMEGNKMVEEDVKKWDRKEKVVVGAIYRNRFEQNLCRVTEIQRLRVLYKLIDEKGVEQGDEQEQHYMTFRKNWERVPEDDKQELDAEPDLYEDVGSDFNL